jgi:hypothetical protein
MNKNLLSTLTNLNTINIGLMIISLGLAYVLPFEIFLLSYAVLGPLHYLTELSWLKDKNFFLPYKSDKYYLLVVFILIMIGSSIILPYKSLAVFI